MRRIIYLFFMYLTICSTSACGRIEPLKVGDAVWAQWTPQLWYRGRIEAPCERGFKIRFDAQDEKCSPPAELAKDITPTRATLDPGMVVLAPGGSDAYRRAKVIAESGWKYEVEFEDGSRGSFSLKELRLPFAAQP